MQVKSSWILLAALLSTSALTSATARAEAPAGPMTPAAPMTPAVASAALPVWAVAPCAATSLTSSNAGLTKVPAPMPMDTVVCGSCSVPGCRGVVYNSACGSPLHPSTCVAALGNDCSVGVPQCQCWLIGQPFP